MSTLQDLTVAAFDTKEVVTIDVSDSLEVAFGVSSHLSFL